MQDNPLKTATLRAAIIKAIDNDDITSLKPLIEDVRRIKNESTYSNIVKDTVDHARQQGCTDILAYLTEQNPFQFNSHTGFMEVMTLVHGIEDEDWDVEFALARLKLMVTRGWDVNDKSEKTPIVSNSALKLVLPYLPLTTFLLTHTYNPSETYPNNSTPLSLASSHSWPAQATLLLHHGAPTTSSLPLLTAAKTGNLPMMRLLLDAGIPIDGLAEMPLGGGAGRRATPRVETALHVAAREDEGAARYLVGRGADPSVRDWEGKMAWERVPGGKGVSEGKRVLKEALRRSAMIEFGEGSD